MALDSVGLHLMGFIFGREDLSSMGSVGGSSPRQGWFSQPRKRLDFVRMSDAGS
jgi:hypothetical protein